MFAPKIAIVDDHPLYRLGIQSVLNDKLPEITVVGEYASAKELFSYLERGLHPDMVILDIIVPGISGVEIARILREKYPKIKILVLSSEVNFELVDELITIGVNGYLSKTAMQCDLIAAISSVLAGNHFYGKDIARIMYNIYIKANFKPVTTVLFSEPKKETKLTKREKEIINLLCEGIAVKEIATILCVSPRTIDNHKANIMKKLGFHNRIELVKYAIKEGIVRL
jgi:DNA-binding NarL/FixJ family response regulator